MRGESAIEPRSFNAMVSWLGYINLALAAFNMVPGYPLDGGRILRAILWWKTGDVNVATRLAAKTGQAVGGLFIVVGHPAVCRRRGFRRTVDLVHRLVSVAGGERECAANRPRSMRSRALRRAI